MPHPASAPASICILRLSAIGDITHMLPLLRTLQHQWPHCQITWVIGALEHQLIGDIADVEFIVVHKKRTLREYFRLRQLLRQRHFDVLLHMQASWRANIFSLAINAASRIGFDKTRARNSQWLFSNQKISPQAQNHVLDSFLQFAETLGIVNPQLIWDLPIPTDASTAMRARVQTPYLVINACSSARLRNFRNWSTSGYAAVIDYAYTRYDLRTVLSGGNNAVEKNLADEIYAACTHKPINLVGQTNLKQLAALLQSARVVIAPDTGPLHIANAVGTDVIGLYASSNPARTGPYGQLEYVVNAYPAALEKFNQQTIATAPWGQRVRDPDVMNMIKPEEVIKMLDKILQKK
ncbi:MAG: glycosyltransferase family 9 protein [Gammaproteobacteria bacterium]|nr:glycosyltransferase family 9 protein [Gammaproteobacteria bacterium]